MVISKNNLSYIGKKITVTVDRPLGSAHPRHPENIYEVNYGYAEGILAGDGAEQDVYLLGIDKPIERAEAVVIAVILRPEDKEDKWVAVPEELVGGELCCKCNIEHAVDFTERYFNHTIYAKYEKTCGAVIYCDTPEGVKFFIIRNKSGHIGFPKGHIEYGESERDTTLREVFEECGLRVKLDEDFRAEYTFNTLEDTIKTSVFFLGKFDISDAIKIQREEVTDEWLLDADSVMNKLNWEQDKEIFRKALEQISK